MMIKSIQHRNSTDTFLGLIFSELFLKYVQNLCIWTLLWLEQLEEERQECGCALPCLLKDTCWVAWFISSSFSRLSGLCGADYQEELIPVALLISLIRAPGRWLEGSCMSRGRSGTAICTGMVVVIYTTVKWWNGEVLNYSSRIEPADVFYEAFLVCRTTSGPFLGNPGELRYQKKEVMFRLSSTGKSIKCQKTTTGFDMRALNKILI